MVVFVVMGGAMLVAARLHLGAGIIIAGFTEDDPGFGRASAMWLRDKPVRWLGQCLHAESDRVPVG